jgi:hypothetical protein
MEAKAMGMTAMSRMTLSSIASTLCLIDGDGTAMCK